MPLTHTLRRGVIASLAPLVMAALVACESESDPNDPNQPPEGPALNEVVTAGPFNASSTDTLVYFSFASGTLVAKTADWDVGLRRYEIRLNGGISGTKGVLGYAMDNNKTATDAQVLAFTVSNTLAAFDAVREAQIPADTAFKSDRLVENAYGYLNLAGIPSANATAYWKVRTANGGFALMRVSAIALNPQSFALTSITVESRLQNGVTLGALQTATVPVGAGPVSISLVTNAAVTPSGCNWDINVDPQELKMVVNAACNAGTYPGPSSPVFANATAANDASQYAAYLTGLTGPIPNSVTSTSAPFRYNLENTNRLYPAFNTYLIKSGTSVYKLQVINYYGAAGESAHPTLRYARIR